VIELAGKIVEWDQLWQVVYASLGAGLGFALAFSVAVAGATRFTEERRAGSPGRAALFAVLAAIGLAVVAAGIVFGVVVMTQKT
jgi:cation transporter-like permease